MVSQELQIKEREQVLSVRPTLNLLWSISGCLGLGAGLCLLLSC